MPDDPNLLIGGYATDTLDDDERRRLYHAALEDPSLFEELVEDDALREILADPTLRAQVLSHVPERSKSWTLVGWMRWRSLLQSMAVVAVVAVPVGVIYQQVANRPATTDVDSGEATRFLQAGQLVSAAELIEEALSVEPEHEEFQALAARLRVHAEQEVAGSRAAAQGVSDALLGPPREAETEAIRLWEAGNLAFAVRAYVEAARLYLGAELAGADLDDLVARARSVLMGVWADGRYAGARQLEGVVPYLESARNRASEDIAVRALVDELWDTASAHVERAREAAVAAGGNDLDPFPDALEQEAEARRLRDGGDLGVAVATVVSSAALFEDARDHARLRGRIRRALDGATTALAEGQLVQAISDTERGVGLTRNPDWPARPDEFLTLRDEIVSRAESEAIAALAALPPTVVADDGESLLREADDAQEASQFVRAVEAWVDAAAMFEDATASFNDPRAREIREIRASTSDDNLEGATRQAAVLLSEAGDELGLAVLTVLGELRAAAERRVAEAKSRAAVNTTHPAYATAQEQEMGARNMSDPRQVVDAVPFYQTAALYYDEATEAAVVQQELDALIEAWERAFTAGDDAAVLTLYRPRSRPGEDTRGLVENWLRSFGSPRRWETQGCAPVRRNIQGDWFATCDVTVTRDGNEFDQTYEWAVERRGGTLIIVDSELVVN